MLFTRYLRTINLEIEWIMCMLCYLLLAPSILQSWQEIASIGKKLGFSKIARGRKNDTFLSISESVLSHAYSKEVE